MLPSILKLEKEISDAYARIKKIQSKCPHPDGQVEVIYSHNDGGYDGPAFASYHALFNCLRCGKRWGADSKENSQEYRRPATRVERFSD